MLQLNPLLMAACLLTPAAAAQTSFVVPANTTQLFDTDVTPLLLVDEFILEPSSVLIVRGSKPLIVVANQRIEIDGILDAAAAFTPNVPTNALPTTAKAGGQGGAGGGEGGFGSPNTTGSSGSGQRGSLGFGVLVRASGGGGESSVLASSSPALRQGAGGGGGRLAADLPLLGAPTDPFNLGLAATDGQDGSSAAVGALTELNPARGGTAGRAVFTDGNPNNDFFGFQLLPSGQLIQGELAKPVGGSAGGAGGDSINSSGFPVIPWAPANELCGAGGGAGGGLVILTTRSFRMGSGSYIDVNGGQGGRGQGVLGQEGFGGAGGGGSGGMLIIQATQFDFSATAGTVLSARGGRGGPGQATSFVGDNSGGMGGPGLIQLHAWNPASIQLPAGATLDQLSMPPAKLLLPL